MAVTIKQVEAGSIAAKHRIAPGHRLLRVGGQEIRDVLDYRFYITESKLDLDLEDTDGKAYSCSIRKSMYDDLGLVFDSYLMDQEKSCKNRCVFCFIDQLPPNLRESLYFKDDDSRLSFLFGNYITLTNLEDEDIDRIIQMRISPVNISVHTTNPILRKKMMENPRSGEVLTYIPRLLEAGIQVNAQLVLCPGWNDGEELKRSLGDLMAMSPPLESVAAVPVGLTRFRDNLPHLRLFTPQEAADVIAAMDEAGEVMEKEHGRRIFYAADELYLKAGLSIPPPEFYEDFPQLENGVGMLAMLEYSFLEALEDTPSFSLTRRVTIATGKAAAPTLTRLAKKAECFYPGLSVEVRTIENQFFGSDITVAGLITGTDLLQQLSGQDLGDALLIPSNMLRHERDLFLDSLSLEEVQSALGIPIRLVEDDGARLLNALLHNPHHNNHSI